MEILIKRGAAQVVPLFCLYVIHLQFCSKILIAWSAGQASNNCPSNECGIGESQPAFVGGRFYR